MTDKVKTIIKVEEFGKINIKLNDIMEKRNISTYELSTKTQIRFQTIQALRENKSLRVDLELLAKICFALNCKVQDILEYEENKIVDK